MHTSIDRPDSSKQLICPNRNGGNKFYRLLLPVLLLLFSATRSAAFQQPVLHENRFSDSVAVHIKDSLKQELLNARLTDPATERKYLTRLLKEEQATITPGRKKHGQRFYYRLAVAFTKLRLYPLAMKCYFKTLTIENRADTTEQPP
ncbi:MAG TPA: hypothetical protein VIM55_12530, partial [Mucilaginibacter sp.]